MMHASSQEETARDKYGDRYRKKHHQLLADAVTRDALYSQEVRKR